MHFQVLSSQQSCTNARVGYTAQALIVRGRPEVLSGCLLMLLAFAPPQPIAASGSLAFAAAYV